MKWLVRLSPLVWLFIVASCVTSPDTGKQSFNMIPEGTEMSLGEQSYREVLAKQPQSTNARWTGIVQRVGNRIAAAANKPDYKWEFRLLESPEKNAFCLPGGKVAFYTGILPVAQTEAGIAVVMGHEVAHATERHGGQRMSTQLGVGVGLSALSLAIGGEDRNPTKQLLFAALGIGATLGVILPFSRSNESDADKIGLKFMAKAGYDPREGAKFWSRMAQGGGSNTPTILSTHPASSDRQASLAAVAEQVWPLYQASAKYGLGETL